MENVGAEEQRERSEIISYAIETPLTPSRPDDSEIACRLVHQSSHQYPIQYLHGDDSVPTGNQAVPLPEFIEECSQSRQPSL